MNTSRDCRAAAAGALLSALIAAPDATAERGPLDAEQVRSLVSGNTLQGPYGARPYDFTYTPGGDIYGSVGPSTDSGRWTVRDDGVYCHSWTLLFGGSERCYRWFEIGGGRYRMRSVDAFRQRDLDVWQVRRGTTD